MALQLGKRNTGSMTAEAFAEAYLSGFRLTVRFLRSKGVRIEAAEEFAQTAWVRGWEARGQLKREDRILPWINSIAYHRFCSDRRRSVRHSELNEISDPGGSSPTDTLDAGILLRLCSPVEKKLLTQRYLEGLEMKEIAATQGLTEMAVRVRIHRCQCSLRARVVLGTRNARSGYPRVGRGMAPIAAQQAEPRAA